MATLWWSIPVLFFVLGCSGNDGGDAQGNGGNIRVVLKSSDATRSRGSRACNFNIDAVNHSGECFTPLNVVGKAASISLDNSLGMGAGGAHRILDFGGGSELSTNQTGAVAVFDFDFSTTAQATNESSEDTLSDQTYYYDRANVLLATLDVQFEIPGGNMNVTNHFWTVRHFFVPHPILDDDTIDACITDPAVRASIESKTLFSAPTVAKLGDLMVCEKATADAVCADSDFQWVDPGTGNLTGTRPGTPVQLTGAHAIGDISCEASESGPPKDMSLGGLGFGASFPSFISFRRTQGEDGTYTYTFNDNCTATSATDGSCSGTAQENAKVLFTLDFDLTDALFVENTVDLTADTDEVIRQNLAKVLLKPVYVENNKPNPGNGNSPQMTATPTVTLTSSFEGT